MPERGSLSSLQFKDKKSVIHPAVKKKKSINLQLLCDAHGQRYISLILSNNWKCVNLAVRCTRTGGMSALYCLITVYVYVNIAVGCTLYKDMRYVSLILSKNRKSVNLAVLQEVRQPYCPRTGSPSTSLQGNYRKYNSFTVQCQEVRQFRSTGILGSTTALLSKDRKSVDFALQELQ